MATRRTVPGTNQFAFRAFTNAFTLVLLAGLGAIVSCTLTHARVLSMDQANEAIVRAHNVHQKTLANRDAEFGSETTNADDSNACIMDMEYKVMKRVQGQCTKLGLTATGCVAGDYLHPFHPDCL